MPIPGLSAALPMKWIGIGVGALLLIATVYFSISAYGSARYKAGEVAERAVWEEEVRRVREERDAAMLVAAENDAVIAAAGEDAIEQAREELDNAVEGIPDQGLSARQRARACFELQRQGRRCPTEPASAP